MTFSRFRPLLTTAVSFLIFSGGMILSGFWTSFSAPSFIRWLEQRLGQGLDFEMQTRFYLSLIVLTLILVYLIWSLGAKNRRHLFISLSLLTAFLILPLIFIFDRRHSLTEEMSWIRYPSSFFLLLAGSAFFLVSRRFNRGQLWPERNELIWLVLSAGFIFAGFDEIGEIHEKIGRVLEKAFSLAHFTTDLVTIFYFFAGLAILIAIFPTLTKVFAETSVFSSRVIFFAVLLFGAASFFDTFDNFILNQMRQTAAALASDNYFFSDAWQILYEPKKTLNGLEEIFEYFAAVLFFAAGALILKDWQSPPRQNQDKINRRRKIRLILPAVSTVFLAILLIPPLFFAGTDKSSPLETNSPAEVQLIASVKDGLFHSDDLTFQPEWGIVLANESEPPRRGSFSAPGVFVFQNEELRRIPDPQNLLADIDSAAADGEALYASDGTQGKIFKYGKENKEWRAAADRKTGLKNPEALARQNNDLYILDENNKTVSRLTAEGLLRVDRPEHPLFQSPESIVYHPLLKTFLISDDKTGIIFKYEFGGKPEIWLNQKNGLQSPEDLAVGSNGDIYVTDNGRGELLIFNSRAELKQILRFRPLFRDLQGVALDEAGNIFVVTADGFGSSSFMPSYLWKIVLKK